VKCVVLAAGCGSRLVRGRSKLLEPVYGVALVEHLIATTARVGVDDFFVVTGYQAERVEGAYLDEHGLDAAFDDYAGFEPGWSKDRQVELLAERHGLSRDRVLFVGDSPRDAQLLRRTGVHFVGVHGLFPADQFRLRGLQSVDDLAALSRLWHRYARRRMAVAAATSTQPNATRPDP
jgi:phosphoglycolate phosphatase-like HAD superfamily hydrolase